MSLCFVMGSREGSSSYGAPLMTQALVLGIKELMSQYCRLIALMENGVGSFTACLTIFFLVYARYQTFAVCN